MFKMCKTKNLPPSARLVNQFKNYFKSLFYFAGLQNIFLFLKMCVSNLFQILIKILVNWKKKPKPVFGAKLTGRLKFWWYLWKLLQCFVVNISIVSMAEVLFIPKFHLKLKREEGSLFCNSSYSSMLYLSVQSTVSLYRSQKGKRFCTEVLLQPQWERGSLLWNVRPP